LFSKSNGVSDDFVKVKRGAITQIVSVTGKTKAVSNVDLSFEKSGRVVNIPVKVGDRARSGQVLATLESSELRAQLSDALANVEVQRAKLNELLAGSRPEDIKIRESELAKAEQDLINYYGGVINISNDAFNKTDDALRQQLDLFFNNDEYQNPTLTFELNDSQLKTNIESQRLSLGLELKKWGAKLATVGPDLNTDELDSILQLEHIYLNKLQIFLNEIFQAVNSSVALSAENTNTYKGNVDAARANVNTAVTSVTGRVQDISAQKIVVQKAKYQLELDRAGSTKEQISGQEAQLRQAEAKVQVIQAQISQNSIVAPFSGLIAKQDLEVGEVAAANKTFISLISDDNLEIEANVPEINIGRVMNGNSAIVRFDAFSSEAFLGKVVYIEPAETLIEGVVNYKIKVLLDKSDPRVRSGLTADIDIITLSKEKVIKVPGFALEEQSEGIFFARVKNGRGVELIPVEIGLRGSNGEVEILSGLSEGNEVMAMDE